MAAIQLITAPGMPAILYPVIAARLMAMAPGADWATADISIKSSKENACFLSINCFFISGIIIYPPPTAKQLMIILALNNHNNR